MFYFRDIYKKELTHKWNYCIKRTSIGISDKSYRGLETSNWQIRHQKWLLLNLQQPLNLYIKNNNKRVNTASTVIQSSPIRINKNELFLTSTLIVFVLFPTVTSTVVEPLLIPVIMPLLSTVAISEFWLL